MLPSCFGASCPPPPPPVAVDSVLSTRLYVRLAACVWSRAPSPTNSKLDTRRVDGSLGDGRSRCTTNRIGSKDLSLAHRLTLCVTHSPSVLETRIYACCRYAPYHTLSPTRYPGEEQPKPRRPPSTKTPRTKETRYTCVGRQGLEEPRVQ